MDFIYYAASSYTLLWVDTIEYDRAIGTLAHKCRKTLKSTCFSWDMSIGIKALFKLKSDSGIEIDNDNIQPKQPIDFICSLKNKHNIIFCKDYHLFLNNASQSVELWRTLLNSIGKLKENNNIFVIVSPYTKLLSEIERYFTVLDYPLPSRKELEDILDNFIEPKDKQNTNLVQAILNNGLGLTDLEFENALALSMAKYGEIKPEIIYEQKKQLLKRNSCLELCSFDKDFNSIAGLEVLKDFVKKMVLSTNGRGVCLLGPPGTGKSYFAKCLGKETSRITISLDFGKLMGSLVGETEKNTREALKTIESLSPCILFIDEIEKGLIGMSSNNTDSGVGIRQGGQFLTWLNDHRSDVYVIATANDVSKLPSELLRSERWDALFFVDLPNKLEQESLLKLYKKEYSISKEEDVDLESFTGAEIKSMCRLASSLKTGLTDAKRYITPVYKTHKEKIEQLRIWAEDRTIKASLEEKLEVKKNHSKSEKGNVINLIK